MIELTEKIILDTYSRPHVALSIGGCGILTEAMTWRDGYGGGHDENHVRSRSFALAFAHRVLCEIGLPPAHEQIPTPQILVDAAVALNDGTTHLALTCTTWQALPEGVEICSVGASTVLVLERETIRKVIAPHTHYE